MRRRQWLGFLVLRAPHPLSPLEPGLLQPERAEPTSVGSRASRGFLAHQLPRIESSRAPATSREVRVTSVPPTPKWF